MLEKRRTPVNERIRIEVEGSMKRLNWIAKKRPYVLLKIIAGDVNYKSNRKRIDISAILSVFAQAGKNKKEVIEMGERLGLNMESIPGWIFYKKTNKQI